MLTDKPLTDLNPKDDHMKFPVANKKHLVYQRILLPSIFYSMEGIQATFDLGAGDGGL
jgi:hypothetical protein